MTLWCAERANIIHASLASDRAIDMSFKLEEIQAPISARITGLDLRKPL